MTAALRARSRRLPGTLSQLAEIRRLRVQLAGVTAERDQARGQLAALLESTDYDLGAYWHQLARWAATRAAAEAWAAGVSRGRQIEAAEREAAWRAIAAPAARGGPPFTEVELRRWGPGGRARFGAPRPGDFTGTAGSQR